MPESFSDWRMSPTLSGIWPLEETTNTEKVNKHICKVLIIIPFCFFLFSYHSNFFLCLKFFPLNDSRCCVYVVLTVEGTVACSNLILVLQITVSFVFISSALQLAVCSTGEISSANGFGGILFDRQEKTNQNYSGKTSFLLIIRVTNSFQWFTSVTWKEKFLPNLNGLDIKMNSSFQLICFLLVAFLLFLHVGIFHESEKKNTARFWSTAEHYLLSKK